MKRRNFLKLLPMIALLPAGIKNLLQPFPLPEPPRPEPLPNWQEIRPEEPCDDSIRYDPSKYNPELYKSINLDIAL